MLAHQWAALATADDPTVTSALELVTGLDELLVGGVGRRGGGGPAALTALAQAHTDTPLADPLGQGVTQLAAGSVTDAALAALAAGRAGLWGAIHDALLDRVDTGLGRPREQWPATAPAGAAGQTDPPGLAGCRAWLRDLAVAGWRGVEPALVTAADQTRQALWAEPTRRRLAVLLDGFAAELQAVCPAGPGDPLPVRRWADLWTRAVLLSQPGAWADADAAPPTPVTGTLQPLGAVVHEHGTVVAVQVHALLDVSGEPSPRLVRTSVNAAKVDTIVGPAVWGLLDTHPTLLRALAERRALSVTDAPLHASGDLRWHDEQARLADPVDPFTAARLRLSEAVAAASPPWQRHPAGIAVPVLVEGEPTKPSPAGEELLWRVGDHPLPVDLASLPRCGPLTPTLVAGACAMLGLLGWDDGRWALRPMAVQTTVKKKPAVVATADWAQGPTDPKIFKAAAKAGDPVAVLRERAGRLLRK
ncbi:hypothetical protein JQS43_09845 [Natronosporangium hydrolyticum]|uniref:Uncharacterized protein n=1 Tax=Natronosporangium hydrolyticum TaxID=2811111 RepID=A0A895YMK3_9ACTN|nr:hypothetical protein [Natronosporangium hydrolyticum]QSB16543.1 hypothetical protein JQS43_09845 [Natronosporangium hydrolyticum]